MSKSIYLSEKEKTWKERLARAAEFPGSNSAFCKAEGVSTHTFRYWKQKFNDQKEADAPSSRTSLTSIYQSLNLFRINEFKWIDPP